MDALTKFTLETFEEIWQFGRRERMNRVELVSVLEN